MDDHYPARPQELENVCLYDFVKCYDVVKEIKDNSESYKFEYGIIKKRKLECLVSHKIYNVQQNPEHYFYSLLLLFKPWRRLEDLKGNNETYTEAFDGCKIDLISALQHHEKLQEIQTAKGEVENLVNDLVVKNNSNDEVNKTNEFHNIEAAGAMNEFRNVLANENEDLHTLLDKMNADQLRVFNYVTNTLQSPDLILRHFVSGVGGTGKSFLIKILKSWVVETLNKEVAVCAPTGISAFNINGLTIHRLLQLPIEHGGVPSYTTLNDDVLQILRNDLKHVALIIIDEISMVSNITLMYIHLRLSEIFNTTFNDNGWFGKIHILLFGDLLQLPPVMQHAPFMDLTKSETEKYLSCLHATNIWKDLFSYDELSINMRQKDDPTFVNILSRIRLGLVCQEDQTIISGKTIQLQGDSIEDKLLQLCSYIQKLPKDTICLLPTKAQSEAINKKMLDLLPGCKKELIAKDDIECDKKYFKDRALKKLKSYEDDNSRTAGLDKQIEVKQGAKIMLRRNIDVTLGLVNGAIGTIADFLHDPAGTVTAIDVNFHSAIHRIEPVLSKFEILPKIFVYRKQFPISLAYGITIHKSQGLSLSSCLIDVGNSIFTNGQTYVAMSRVTNLNGLHIINFDPKSVTAHNKSILEYNRLRQKYRPDLDIIKITRSAKCKTKDQICYSKLNNCEISSILHGQDITETKSFIPYQKIPPGYSNVDVVSCYANAICQCLFCFEEILSRINCESTISQAIKMLIKQHLQRNCTVNTMELRKELGFPFVNPQQQDAEEFLTALINRNQLFNNLTTNINLITKKCTNSACGYAITRRDTSHFVRLYHDQTRRSIHIKKIIEDNCRWETLQNETKCELCNSLCFTKTEIEVPAQIIICQIMIWDKKGNKNVLNIAGVPNTILKFNNEHYKLQSAVFHEGIGAHKGHYKSMVRVENSWIMANDNRVFRIEKWPRNSKDAYLLFYKKI